MHETARIGCLAALAALAGACTTSDAVPDNGLGAGISIRRIGDAGADVVDAAKEQAPPPDVPTTTDDFYFDTFNVALAGSFSPWEAERRAELGKALAAAKSDVVCLQEVWRDSDKDLVKNATKDVYPYAVSFQHDLDTKLDDATDEKGQTPAPFTTPPCGTPKLKSDLENAISCVKANCSTIPNSDDGMTTSTGCAAAKCVGSVGGLLTGGDAEKRCYGCLAPMLPASTFKQIRDQCTTNPNAGLAFDGRSGVVLLSKHPIDPPGGEVRVVPGTWNRRIFVRAGVKLPNGAAIDVYCTHLTAIFSGFTYPYTGQYGAGKTGSSAWEAEQNLQAQKLLDWIKAKTGDAKPAVVLGDFNASRKDEPNGIKEDGSSTLDILEKDLKLAVWSGYQPKCTFCTDNPLNKDSAPDPVWIDRIFVNKKIDPAAVKLSVRTFDEAYIQVTIPDAGAAKSTLSDHYGLRSLITIKP